MLDYIPLTPVAGRAPAGLELKARRARRFGMTILREDCLRATRQSRNRPAMFEPAFEDGAGI
ncbi:MAG: hypothetical protein GIW95_12325 [Candidatus Eremiobacteraeota bacterium]|nr:hypothetical protein [Candidatus Eremiobacteraeota bacterium]